MVHRGSDSVNTFYFTAEEPRCVQHPGGFVVNIDRFDYAASAGDRMAVSR